MDEQTMLDRFCKIEKDVDALFKRQYDILERLIKIESHQEEIIKGLDKLELALKELNCKPGQRWDSLVNTGIAAVVGGTIGYFVSKIGK